MVTPNKSKRVPIVLVNTNSYNVWVRQPLLGADIVVAEHCPWEYQPVMSHDSNNIKVSFCPVQTSDIQAEILATSASDGTKTKNMKLGKTKKRNKARGLSLGLDPSSMIQNLISKKI